MATPASLSLSTGGAPISLLLGDLNSDGTQDLAVVNYGSSTVSILLSRRDKTFATKVDYGTGPQPNSIAMGDLNGDGTPDLAVTNSGASTVSVLLGAGDGTFAAKVD